MGRKKTHKEFVDQVASVNKDIEIVGTYTGSPNRIEVRCLKDKSHGTWYPTADSLLSGYSCPKCNNESKTKTPKEFKSQVALINENIEIVGIYTGARYKIETLCLKDKTHGNWFPTASNLLKGSGCPKCSGKHRYKQEEFEKEVYTRFPDIGVLGKYVNNGTKIGFYCKKDLSHHPWETTPGHILSGTGCPTCANHGFNTSKPGHVYLGEILFEKETYYKVGITNKKPSKRLNQCHDSFKLITSIKFTNGYQAQALEKTILLEMSKYRTEKLKGYLKSGYTEILTKMPSLNYFK